MNSAADLFFAALRSWFRTVTDGVWAMIRKGGGGGASWMASHWLSLIISIIIISVLVDWTLYLIRWRPYRLFLTNLRRKRRGGNIAVETARVAAYAEDDQAGVAAAPEYDDDNESYAQEPEIDVAQSVYADDLTDEMEVDLSGEEYYAAPYTAAAPYAANASYTAAPQYTYAAAEPYAAVEPYAAAEPYAANTSYAANEQQYEDTPPQSAGAYFAQDNEIGNELGNGIGNETPFGEWDDDFDYAQPPQTFDYAQPQQMPEQAPEQPRWDNAGADIYRAGSVRLAEKPRPRFFNFRKHDDSGLRKHDDSILTVTGKPAKRRGLFRLADDQDEAISGLPPMMPLEQGYYSPTMPSGMARDYADDGSDADYTDDSFDINDANDSDDAQNAGDIDFAQPYYANDNYDDFIQDNGFGFGTQGEFGAEAEQDGFGATENADEYTAF